MRCVTADVVVIGGGGSALAAAAEAAALGRSVVLLEKNPALGGSTAWSVGSVSASNTPHQIQSGIQDSPDEHFEDLGKFAGALEVRDNLVLRRVLVDNATDTFNWLIASGLVFLGPTLEPPHRYPRMHNVVPSSRAYPFHLGRLCRSLGVDIRLSVRAQELKLSGSRVVGVIALDVDGQSVTFLARRGVVLATGDFSAARDMKAHYASDVAARASPVNVNNTGDGHAMATNIGATVVNGDLVHGPLLRFIPPERPSLVSRLPLHTALAKAATLGMKHMPQRLIRPILMSFVTTALGPDPGLFRAGARLVNQHGDRFANELDRPQIPLVDQPSSIGYIVMDNSIASKFSAWPNFVSTAPNVAYAYLADYKRNRQDIYHQASDPEQLAERLGMNPAALRKAMLESIEGRPALTIPPFIALGPAKSYVVFTDGGLKVSEQHEVIGAGDVPIPGLYAAGSLGQGGLLLYGHGHHLAWAFVSGRRAGRNAALTARHQ